MLLQPNRTKGPVSIRDGSPRDNARPKSLVLECEGGGGYHRGLPDPQPPPLPPRGAKHPTSETLKILESIENASNNSNDMTRGNTVPRDFLFYPSVAPSRGSASWWARMLPWPGGGRSQVLNHSLTVRVLPPAGPARRLLALFTYNHQPPADPGTVPHPPILHTWLAHPTYMARPSLTHHPTYMARPSLPRPSYIHGSPFPHPPILHTWLALPSPAHPTYMARPSLTRPSYIHGSPFPPPPILHTWLALPSPAHPTYMARPSLNHSSIRVFHVPYPPILHT